MLWPLLRLAAGRGRAQPGVEFGQGAVSSLAVLLEGLRLHHLSAVAAHHQVEVIVAGVQAEDGHVFEWREGERITRSDNERCAAQFDPLSVAVTVIGIVTGSQDDV